VFFDTSLSPGSYYYSSGRFSQPSSLRLINGKLPVEAGAFISGPNALELDWNSVANGGWTAEVDLHRWRNRPLEFPGANLWLWIYAADRTPAKDLPLLAIRDADRGVSRPVAMGDFTQDLPGRRWIRVRIPLTAFPRASVSPFQPHRLLNLVFMQGAADGQPHTPYIDDIRIEDDPPAHLKPPAAPQGATAKGYERHIDITWDADSEQEVAWEVLYW